MHDNTLINEFVNDQNHIAHAVNQALSLDVVLEDPVEALVNAVQNHAEDQFVIFLQAKHENCHVFVASEDGDIIIYSHDIVFKLAGTASSGT